MRHPGSLMALVSLILLVAVCAVQLAFAGQKLKDDESAVIERTIATPAGLQKCFIWLGPGMSWGIRPFVSLGCWPMPAPIQQTGPEPEQVTYAI